MANDVFQVGNGVPANYSDGTIKVSVNGTLLNNRYQTGAMTIGQLVDQIAKSKGIRTFSVYVDGGRKLLTGEATKKATDFQEVDVVAKDSRG